MQAYSDVTRESCNICCRPAASPFRVYENDRIVHGCVAAFHNDHLVPVSESARWHNRPEAKKIRASLAKFGK